MPKTVWPKRNVYQSVRQDMTQPAFSRRYNLEEWVGTPLSEKQGATGAHLTSAGEVFTQTSFPELIHLLVHIERRDTPFEAAGNKQPSLFFQQRMLYFLCTAFVKQSDKLCKIWSISSLSDSLNA
ncbi:hypothetical protein KCP78_02420 [Salmonella enterica subsp. enterica]|nr:hypothetical protein KCP78_02420 [Salmonella enterica subsp. enterica]